MGIIDYSGNVVPYGTDKDILKIRRIREDRLCVACGKVITKGSYAFGDTYNKRCINCGLKVCDWVIQGLNEWVGNIEKTKKYIKDNREMLDINNAVANI